MDYITTRDAAVKWGYNEKTVCKWCRDGLISAVQKAKKINGRWQIPVDAQCPKPVKV